MVLEAGGIKIAVFAVTYIWNQGPIEEHAGRKYVAWAKWDALRHRVAHIRPEVDFVLLSYHGGAEYIDVPMSVTRRFVKVRDEGRRRRDHRPPPLTCPRASAGTPTAPSSYRHFVFAGHEEQTWTNYGMLAKLTLNPDERYAPQACPFVIEGHIPEPL